MAAIGSPIAGSGGRTVCAIDKGLGGGGRRGSAVGAAPGRLLDVSEGKTSCLSCQARVRLPPVGRHWSARRFP
jgi:hypothetical protein